MPTSDEPADELRRGAEARPTDALERRVEEAHVRRGEHAEDEPHRART